MEYGYIGVSLHGHFESNLAVKYSFAPELNAKDGIDPDALPEWQASLPDPEAIVRCFVNVRECYVMWQNAIGHYYGLITTNPLDPQTGRVMVTIMVQSGVEINGRTVFTALNGLKKVFLEEGNTSDSAVLQVLHASGVPVKPLMLPAWKTTDGESVTKSMCYRTYLSTRELETIFSFPNQPEYDKYAHVIAVTATCSLRPGIKVERIMMPIKKTYSVVSPEDVTPSQTTVTDGDRLSLTYQKPGFNPRKETVTIGSPSPYVHIEGSVVVVKTPAESGLGFTRRVRLTVISAKGGMINGYTVSVNDRQVNTMDPFIELTESDLKSGHKVVIQAASNNYHPLKVELDPDAIDADKGVELVLVPIEQGIVLRLDFGENRVFEQHISIEKNTPEYSQLHSGNFHGFRAHRLATAGEVYHVDVRAAGKPVTPAFENVTGKNETLSVPAKRVVPVFEKVGGKKEEPKPAVEPKPIEEEKPVEKPAKKAKSVDENGDTKGGKMKLRPGLFIGIVAILAVIICCIIFLPTWTLKPGKTAQSAENSEIQAVENVAPAAEAAPAAAEPAPAAAPAPAQMSADEQADIEYLNANRKWKRADLKSESARQLFDAIAQGDIKAFVNNPYFTTPNRATNKDAINVADFVWAAYGSPTQRSNEVAMKRGVKEDAVNMYDLYEATARVKPAKDEVNKEPRPGTTATANN